MLPGDLTPGNFGHPGEVERVPVAKRSLSTLINVLRIHSPDHLLINLHSECHGRRCKLYSGDGNNSSFARLRVAA
jgi:hypothetical protein